MNEAYYLKDFDPSDFDMVAGLNDPSAKRLLDHIKNLRVPTPHSLMSERQLRRSIEFMKLRDPLLALLCSLSYRYTLQPYHQLILLRKKDVKELDFYLRPIDTAGYKRSKREIDLDDLRKLEPYLKTSSMSDYLFCTDPHQDLWDNLDLRWSGMKTLMVQRKIIAETHSLFSYYTSSLNCWTERLLYHQIADRLSIKKRMIVEYLFISFGRIPPMNVITAEDYGEPPHLDL